MDRDLAQRIVNAITNLSPPFNALDSLSQQISDPDEARAFRLALGEVMGMTLALLRPVIKKFPDLDPDRAA
ncbi:hypothetical protein [Dongia deserti]|uniref:hypothetical protein n=1 Tax=Dongia deserti TaxID=2268030 RepID=UPI000E65B2D8|nr:hypothetical protein [Dongia deserti]